MLDQKRVLYDATDGEARRAFLLRCGRFAAVTPPVITTLLTVSMIPSEAHASTIGRGNGPGRRPVIAIIIKRLFGWLG
jgi:hypothetical protein